MKKTYTISEIQEILQISKPTAYALVKSGEFSSIRFKKTIRISKDSFDKWLESNLSSVRLEESHHFFPRENDVSIR